MKTTLLIIAAAALLAGCTPSATPSQDARVAELENRVAFLERAVKELYDGQAEDSAVAAEFNRALTDIAQRGLDQTEILIDLCDEIDAHGEWIRAVETRAAATRPAR